MLFLVVLVAVPMCRSSSCFRQALGFPLALQWGAAEALEDFVRALRLEAVFNSFFLVIEQRRYLGDAGVQTRTRTDSLFAVPLVPSVSSSIPQCLSHYLAPQQFSPSLRYDLLALQQQRFVSRLPPILLFTVDRSSPDQSLQLSNYILLIDSQQQKSTFMLFGIVRHTRTSGSADGGHYTSFLFEDVKLPEEFTLPHMPLLPSQLARYPLAVSSRPVSFFDDQDVRTGVLLPSNIDTTCALLFYIRCRTT
jgi:hypothetical protein